MTLIAKLVTVSMVTRVLVEKNASDSNILEKAKLKFIEKIETEIGEHLESIVDDEECPYDPEFDGYTEPCANCTEEVTITKENTFIDVLGKHTVCSKCKSSFDIN